MFKGKKGKQLEKDLGQKTQNLLAGAPGPEALSVSTSGRTQDEVDAIKVKSGFLFREGVSSIVYKMLWQYPNRGSMLQQAIGNARSLEEIERLHEMLQAGQIPGTQVDSTPVPQGMYGSTTAPVRVLKAVSLSLA